MNKYIIIYIFILSNTVYSHSQVGIYTESPKGLLHIDALKNGSTTATEQKDDVILTLDASNIPQLTIGAISNEKSVQLGLGATNKGFLPNRVALQSNTDISIISNPIDGMIVYNTAMTGVGSTDVIPGLYIYYGNKWKYLFTDNTKKINKRILQSDVYPPLGRAGHYDIAEIADYNDPIEIEQTGAYAFAFRLYMKMSANNNLSGYQRLIQYIAIFQNDILFDLAEINPTMFDQPYDDVASYSVVLSGNLNKGDIITVGFYQNDGDIIYHVMYPSGINNLLFYWRLEQYNTN